MYETYFYGKFVPMKIFQEPYYFDIGDIYLPQQNKWLKQDSFAASKLFTNMQILKAAGVFGFYTFSGTPGKFLPDAVARSEEFRILITARIGSYGLKALCFECELIQSLHVATHVGTAQNYRIKFRGAHIEQWAESSGAGRPKDGLGPPSILFPGIPRGWGNF